MVERGYRPGEPPVDEFVCELDLPDGVDEEKEAAYRGWQKFLTESPADRMPLTFRQERRLQVYDRLIWKIDHDRNPVEKELIYR